MNNRALFCFGVGFALKLRLDAGSLASNSIPTSDIFSHFLPELGLQVSNGEVGVDLVEVDDS